MRRKLLAALLAVGLLSLGVATDGFAQFVEEWTGTGLSPWEDPATVDINRMKANATLYSFPDAQGALAGEREDSPWFKSLNGMWKFDYASHAAEAPKGFYREDFSVEGWANIPVPSN